jgi:putative flavoprotein involved in K+ transport
MFAQIGELPRSFGLAIRSRFASYAPQSAGEEETMTQQFLHSDPGGDCGSAAADGVGFVEQGNMFERLTRREHFDVVVIGAGQAGLSTGYYLARRGVRFVILDGQARIGDVWRKRWDSLKLFTACRWDGLPGFGFPRERKFEFPTKDQMGDYLESYAKHFALPVRTSARVELVQPREGGGYLVRTAGCEYLADQVIVAMSSYQRPKVPEFAKDLDPGIVQLHSFDYRNPGQLRAGPTLLVGAGNSGSEIALDIARGQKIWMSGRDVGYVPFRIDSFLGRFLCVPLLLRFLFHRVLTVKTPIGRKFRDKILGHGAPLIRVRRWQLAAAGVERVPRIRGVRDGRPELEDGRTLDPANIVWCTGFHAGLSFIDLPIFDSHGEPRHISGVVPSAPGLYFVGLHFLHAMSSSMIHGVPRDAERIANLVAKRTPSSAHAMGAMPAQVG